MVTENTNPSAFPVNGTYPMQQAWRLYFDRENVTLPESYTIQKNYPAECSVMCGRAFKAMGMNVNVPNPLAVQQISLIDKICFKIFDHPNLTVASSCVFASGALITAVFFWVAIPLFASISAVIHAVGLTVLLMKIKTT